MRMRFLASVILGLSLSPALLLRAQSPARSPHGPLALDCASCHSPERWSPVTHTPGFRHEQTGFVLEGAHANTPCRDCHQKLVFNSVAAACADCHKDPHRGELGIRCETCHTPRTWTNQAEMLRVHSRTRFPLYAAHASLDCQACHKSQRPFEYANTPTDCGSCHARTFEETRNPPHQNVGFGRRCEECHSVTAVGWQSTRFIHPAVFPLRGRHAAVACTACHATADFLGTSRQCVTCHRSDFERTQDPNHVASGFSTVCENCHQDTAWRPASFTDHSTTRFPLTGAHQQVACERCHPGGRFTGTASDCYSCHRDDHAGATNPSHATLPTTCASCHLTSGWRPASGIDHNQTRFPLTGSHTGVDCAQCHKGGNFKGAPTECFACHQNDYNRADNPDHGSFPKECDSCHRTSGWKPANFNHDLTRFALTGAHRGVECSSCHKGGRYRGTPSDCFSCHKADYNGTRNPNHASSGFPTSCEDCHRTNGWKPSTFDHDRRAFPINSGTHRGVWGACTDCHVGGNYGGFECTRGCHAKAETDNDHEGEQGYQYASQACYRCHPRGTKP